MTDATELWLQQNDPAYEATSQGWKHLTTGDYVGPWQEAPLGDEHDLAELEARARDQADGSHRLCAVCGDPFAPRRRGHEHCSGRCRMRAQRARARDANSLEVEG